MKEAQPDEIQTEDDVIKINLFKLNFTVLDNSLKKKMKQEFIIFLQKKKRTLSHFLKASPTPFTKSRSYSPEDRKAAKK